MRAGGRSHVNPGHWLHSFPNLGTTPAARQALRNLLPDCNCNVLGLRQIPSGMSTTKTPTFENHWLEPETWEKLLPGLAAAAAGLAKLKSKLPKGNPSKKELKELGETIEKIVE